MGQSQLVLTSLHEAGYVGPEDTLQLDLTDYFQFYAEPGPVATFTIDMPVLDDEELVYEYQGRSIRIVKYKLKNGGTYEDPYAVGAEDYEWVEHQVDFQLLPEKVPSTVANFMRYAAEAAYSNTIVHRNESTGFVFSPQAAGTDFAGLPFTPLPIIQTGGFSLYDGDKYVLDRVDAYSPIDLEWGDPNSLGTLAMARSMDFPDSATTQFFINLADNSSSFGNLFAVFGELVDPDTDLPILNDWANAPVYDLSTPYIHGEPNVYPTLPFETIPLYAPFPLEKDSYARISSITIPKGDPSGVAYSWEWVSAYAEPTDEEKAKEAAHQAVFDIAIEGSTLNISRHDTGVARIKVIGTDGGDQVAEFEFDMAAYNPEALEIFPSNSSTIYQEGWLENNWYGWMLADTFPEILHLNHRYQFISQSSTSTNLYVYDYGIASWLYINPSIYPSLYSYRLDTWLYYQLGSGSEDSLRWFYRFDGDTSAWVTEDQL